MDNDENVKNRVTGRTKGKAGWLEGVVWGMQAGEKDGKEAVVRSISRRGASMAGKRGLGAEKAQVIRTLT